MPMNFDKFDCIIVLLVIKELKNNLSFLTQINNKSLNIYFFQLTIKK